LLGKSTLATIWRSHLLILVVLAAALTLAEPAL
jgi:hypothetical protein